MPMTMSPDSFIRGRPRVDVNGPSRAEAGSIRVAWRGRLRRMTCAPVSPTPHLRPVSIRNNHHHDISAAMAASSDSVARRQIRRDCRGAPRAQTRTPLESADAAESFEMTMRWLRLPIMRESWNLRRAPCFAETATRCGPLFGTNLPSRIASSAPGLGRESRMVSVRGQALRLVGREKP